MSLSGCLAGKLAEGKNLGYQYSGAPVGPDTIAKALHRFRSSPARPPLMLTSGDKMAETCYEAADGKLKTCPTDRDTCPCVDGKLKCMSLGYCWHALPNVRMKVINFIRNPIDTIIRYAYSLLCACVQLCVCFGKSPDATTTQDVQHVQCCVLLLPAQLHNVTLFHPNPLLQPTVHMRIMSATPHLRNG